MRRFFIKVDGNMCFTRMVTHKDVYGKQAENERWEVIRGLPRRDEANRYCKVLLEIGYTELLTNNVPFCTKYVDTITAELRTDAIKSITEYRNLSDADFLRRWSTGHRWQQFACGEITAEKAREYAEKRMERRVFRDLSEREQELERIRNGNALNKIDIVVEYGHGTTVHAYATIGSLASGRYTRVDGMASGWGYDKTSAAVADALNKSNDARKMLLEVKERALRDGATDVSPTASCGRDNHACIGYGAGYGVLPYFEGGVGMSSLSALFTRHGYTMERIDAPHATCYLFRKKEVNA